MTSLLIAGATGLVGAKLLEQALADPGWTRVVAPTRRPLTVQAAVAEAPAGLRAALESGRVINPVTDFASIEPTLFASGSGKVAAVACALGTTMKRAGSKERFREVDHGLVLSLAKAARDAGVERFGYVSSVGAKVDGASFYLRVKGEVERDLRALGFGSLVILRPSFLGGERAESRPLERVGLGLARALGPLIPRRYRVVGADRVAAALLACLREGRPGVEVLESEAIANAAG